MDTRQGLSAPEHMLTNCRSSSLDIYLVLLVLCTVTLYKVILEQKSLDDTNYATLS